MVIGQNRIEKKILDFDWNGMAFWVMPFCGGDITVKNSTNLQFFLSLDKSWSIVIDSFHNRFIKIDQLKTKFALHPRWPQLECGKKEETRWRQESFTRENIDLWI